MAELTYPGEVSKAAVKVFDERPAGWYLVAEQHPNLQWSVYCMTPEKFDPSHMVILKQK